MKNIVFVSLILMIGFICFLSSCRDSCKNVGAGYFPVANQLKKYSFKSGSYWIYQDSVSGNIDSQSVSNYSAQNHVELGSKWGSDGVQDCAIYTDAFKMTVASFWNGIPYESIDFSTNIGGNTSLQVIYSLHSASSSEIYEYPFLTGNQTDTFANFSVLGHAFPIVYRDVSNFNSQRYYVDSIGVVKWVFNDTINGQHTWNLLRYHVINP